VSDGKIDWNTVRLRLEAISAAIEKGHSPGPGDTERILQARAEVLAREPVETGDKDYIEVVEFLLANEYYCIESRYIREVYPIKDYTPLPVTPSFVLGLINVRGQIVSVIDVKKFFDMPDKGISDLNKAIIISNDTMEFGILADEILGVRQIVPSEIQPPPPTLTGIREEYLRGITREQIVILDAKRLLEDENIVVFEEI
jgi:purine-binding chemotaxis protein CheW